MKFIKIYKKIKLPNTSLNTSKLMNILLQTRPSKHFKIYTMQTPYNTLQTSRKTQGKDEENCA